MVAARQDELSFYRLLFDDDAFRCLVAARLPRLTNGIPQAFDQCPMGRANVGQGNGRVAAVALGSASGAMMAGGSKVSTNSALGGIAGSFLGSLVGQGNGRNAAGAVGASVGAMAGSDCLK